MIITAESYNSILKKSNPFIVFEGINGVGKSTLIRKVSEFFDEKEIPYVSTFEPGGTPVGGEIRKLVLGQSSEENKLPEIAELFLFCADRAIHVEKVIKPALTAGKTVLCDRFIYSTLAFQGYGRRIDTKVINSLNGLASSGLEPDLVVLLDLDVESALRRIGKRNIGEDSFEKEKLDFHQRLRDGFLELASQREENFIVLDAGRTPEELFHDLKKILNSIKD